MIFLHPLEVSFDCFVASGGLIAARKEDPCSNVAICDAAQPGNIHQSFATPRCSALLRYSVQATRWLSWYGVGLASADRLPVVRIPAGPLASLKCDPPKGNGRRPKKKLRYSVLCSDSSVQCGWKLWSLEGQGGQARGSRVFNTIIYMEADHLRENPQTPQQQETPQESPKSCKRLERRQLTPMCAFRFHFWGRKVNWNHGFVCSCVFVFCLFSVSWFVLFRFAFWWWLVTVHRTMYRSFTSSLLRPLYRRRPTHDVIDQLILICNML